MKFQTYQPLLSLATFFVAAILSVSGARAQNHAVDFDGEPGSSVEAAHHPSFDLIERELTMEAWVFPRRTLDEIVVNKENAWEIGLKEGLLRAAVQPDAAVWDWSGTAKIPEKQWSHVAVVHDGTNLITFLNGKKASSEDKWAMKKGEAIKKTPDPFRVGLRGLGGPIPGDPIDGIIDEVRISKVARYTKDFPIPAKEFLPDDDTIVLYHFNERPGSKGAKDESKHHNDGKLTGGTKYVPSTAPIAPASVDPASKLSTTWGKMKAAY
ncbi:LamG domain-containing protein [Candidatus Poribacteria bacterium]|nr:LamG domain-containing protein [Candidatus Poribacteria bacterium]